MQILLQQSKLIPMNINYTPTTIKQGNYPDTPQVDPTEHLTWHHEDTPVSHVPHYEFIIIYYTTPYGPHLARYPLTNKYLTHPRYLGKKLHNNTNGCGTD